ncbi:AraC-like DNA-binding protein [Chryseobacterium sp. 52]|uniref:helix-turn-helix domain-containing protein n=1 Tax=Chryseobacterium sp. 52 TaxID=2035213 RepID=UPI000C1A4F61|nr:AraC family transcriptional regulator [Chryseobacterium sp. 52]PIF46638.1 AraC-like DNA-binding protein [Chryseobacterium sp. 52]
MKFTAIKSCYIGPEISPEQFVQEHFFLFLIKGRISGYDGTGHYSLKPGEGCIVRKNHLARYSKQKESGEFEKIVIIFDEAFLKKFREKHPVAEQKFLPHEAFIHVEKTDLISGYIQSLQSYYTESGNINPVFSDLKREELLLILLHMQPELSGVFFDFGVPGKLDMKTFMQKNYKFNVNIERFAYLTGRSLSGFKRDFKDVFNETPSRWLVKKRLQEAWFLMDKKKQKPSDFYIDLGFEDLSHFSFAFKKEFGVSPSQLVK